MQNYKPKFKIIYLMTIAICLFSFYSLVLAKPVGSPSGGPVGPPSGGPVSGSQSIGNFIRANTFTELVNRIANWIFTLAVPIAVIMIVWAGILFMSACGAEDKITKAKRALTWSVVGLAIAFIGMGFTTLISDILGVAPEQMTGQSVVNSFNRLASFMFYLGPAFAIIFLTWAGITYMLAGGDEKKITDAKKRFWWGVVGTAIVVGVGVIIRTVITNLPTIKF